MPGRQWGKLQPFLSKTNELLELISQLLLEGHAHPFAVIDACLKCACMSGNAILFS
jgi:hypothetical protein